jgi:hypothetical protein
MLVLGLGAVGLILACQSPTEPPMKVKGTGEPLNTDTPVVLDDALQRKTWFGLGRDVKIVLEDHGRAMTPTGTQRVWVRLRNVTNFDQYVQARAHFMSATGEEVEQPSPWMQVFIPAKSIETVQINSTLRDEVKKFYVELREGR